MADFKIYFPIENELEGTVFENDATDVGGCTKYGITLTDIKKYYNNENKTCDDIKNMTTSEAANILKQLYWDYYRADEIKNQSLAMFLVDSRLNQGDIITKFIQSIIGVTIDGIFGNETFNAMIAFDEAKLFSALYDKRNIRYHQIVDKSPKQGKFLNGWINRLNAIKYHSN